MEKEKETEPNTSAGDIPRDEMDQAEHMPRAEQFDDPARCRRDRAEQHCSLVCEGDRAEQRCGAPVRDTQTDTLCPTKTGPVARYVQFPKVSNVHIVTYNIPGITHKVDQAEQEPEPNTEAGEEQGDDACQADRWQSRPDASRDESEPNCGAEKETEPNNDAGDEGCQADQWLSRPDAVRDETELNCGTEKETGVSDGAAGSPHQVRAEQRMSDGGQASSSFKNTQPDTLCPTITGPVARYVDLPVTNTFVQKLITNFDKDRSRAEQMSRAKPRAEPSCQVRAEKNCQVQAEQEINCQDCKEDTSLEEFRKDCQEIAKQEPRNPPAALNTDHGKPKPSRRMFQKT